MSAYHCEGCNTPIPAGAAVYSYDIGGGSAEACGACVTEHHAALKAGDCPSCGARRDLCASEHPCDLPVFHLLVEAAS